jgi:hypothetical protein
MLTPKSKSCCRPKGVRESVPSLYVHSFKKESAPWALSVVEDEDDAAEAEAAE